MLDGLTKNVHMMYYGLLQIVYDPQLKAGNEYDKYFGQPIKLFSYSKLLNTRKNGNIYYYSINNREILEKIALKPTNALEFLYKK